MAPTTVPDFSPATLVAFRTMAGWKRPELARRAGVSTPTLVKYENGQNRPSVVALQRLAEALGVPPEALRERPVSDLAEWRVVMLPPDVHRTLQAVPGANDVERLASLLAER